MHKSVLQKETIEYLKCEDKKVILDCTVGGAGHAKEILKRLPPGGMLIGMDADKGALRIAEDNLKEFKGAFTLVNENFRNFDNVLRRLNIEKIDGALFDLGISSFQLEEERGFSFLKESILDMRMDTNLGEPLWQALNRMSEDELGAVIRDLGEERFWRRIAKAIVTQRRASPIKNSLQLARIIRQSARYSPKIRIDPATRTFQALRIYINDELNALREALDKISRFLNSNARIVVISFHSLEDRIVKHKFRELAKQEQIRVLTKKPVTPGEDEAKDNPRSRSAKLRAAEHV